MDILDQILTPLNAWLTMLLQAMQSTSHLRQALDSLCLALPLAMLMAFAGLGGVSGTARYLAVQRKRASYAKGARQLALLAMLLGWTLLVGSRIWLFYTQGSHAPDSLPNFMLECAWMLLGMAVILVSLYYMLWKPCQNFPKLHAFLGGFCSLPAILATGATLAAMRLFAALDRSDAASITLEQLYTPTVYSPFFCALCMTLPLALALASGFGAFWLVLRRRHDDFGRDHYNTMLPWCAVWARNAWLLFWLFLLSATAMDIYTQWLGNAFTPEDAMKTSLWLLFWLAPIILWSIPARSKTPLRHKLALLAALLIALAGTLPYHTDMMAFTMPKGLTSSLSAPTSPPDLLPPSPAP